MECNNGYYGNNSEAKEITMNDRVPLEQSKGEEQVPVDTSKRESQVNQSDVTFLRVAKFMEVPLGEHPDVKDDVNDIIKWAKNSTNTEDDLYILDAIKNLQKSLRISLTGKRLTEVLSKYARLDAHEKKLRDEMKRIKIEKGLYAKS